MRLLITLIISLIISVSFSGTVVVTNTNNSGSGSLRASIALASAGDTVRFSPSLIAGGNDTIKLSSQIISYTEMIIIGLYNSTDSLFISGQNSTEIFKFNSQYTNGLVIDSIIIVDARDSWDGAAIECNGKMRLSNSIFINNRGFNGYGGAVYVNSNFGDTVYIDNCIFKNNESRQSGGAVYVSSNAKVTNSVFSGNYCRQSGGAIASLQSLTLYNTEFTGNSVQGSGGAISTKSNIVAKNCDFIGNIVTSRGGAVHLYTTQASSYNSAAGIENCNFLNNKASYGGAISMSNSNATSSFTIKSCNFNYNESDWHGGAIYVTLSGTSNLNIVRSTFNKNKSGYYGGAICQINGTTGNTCELNTNILQSTFYNNRSNFGGGDNVYSKSYYKSFINIENSTLFVSDSLYPFTSIYSEATADSSSIFIKGSIVYAGFPNSIQNPSDTNTIISRGKNLFSEAILKGSLPSDSLNVDTIQLLLENLKYNGGFCKTMKPQTGSIALEKGNISDFTDAQNRPISSIREIGACEFNCQKIFYDTVYSCSSYHWKGTNFSASGDYNFSKIDPSNIGCDSVFYLNLIIDNAGNKTVSTCYSFNWYGKNYTTTGTYYQTSTAKIFTCNLIDTLNLTINGTTYDTVNINACNSTVVSFSGKYTYTTSGQYSDTIQNFNNCDSVITINLNFISQKYDTVSLTSCNPIPSPVSSKVFNLSGTYNDTTAKNSYGCDTIYTFNCIISRSLDTLVLTRCNSFTSPFTSKFYTQSGIYFDTTSNSIGCDSIVQMDVTILKIYDSITLNTCSSYTTSSGTLFTSSAVFNDTLTSRFSCDSIVAINLTVGNYQSIIKNIHLCSQNIYRLPSGRTRYISYARTIIDTVTSTTSCDSIYILNFTKGTVNITSSPYVFIDTCTEYQLPSGTIVNTSGFYWDTLTNVTGCDSITRFYYRYSPNYLTQSVSGCGDYTSLLTGKKYYTNGIVVDSTIKTPGLCDTVKRLNITLNNTFDSISINQCGNYNPPSGGTAYSVSGVYYDTILNSVGCDSILKVKYIKNNTIFGSGILKQTPTQWKATKNGATYQWLDCDNGFAVVPGATNQTYTLTRNGSFAVEVLLGQCKDTTRCQDLRSIGISENYLTELSISPNPTNGTFTLDFGKQTKLQRLFITDINGRLIKEIIPQNVAQYEISFEGSSGVYLLNVIGEKERKIIKIIKE